MIIVKRHAHWFHKMVLNFSLSTLSQGNRKKWLKTTYMCTMRSPTVIIFSLKVSLNSSLSKYLSTSTRCAPNRIIWGSPWGLTNKQCPWVNHTISTLDNYLNQFFLVAYKTTINLLPKPYQSILYSVKPCPIRKREKKNIWKTIKTSWPYKKEKIICMLCWLSDTFFSYLNG